MSSRYKATDLEKAYFFVRGAENIKYILQNPVEESLVFNAHEYLYSSARDFAEEKGYLNNVIVVQI